MKASTIQQIKQELATLKPAQLNALCLRLAKFKKENKELLSYLLFEASDEAAYLQSVKTELAEQFASINTGSVYFIKKSLRKIVRIINRYSKYSDETATEIDLRLYFCEQVNAQGWVIPNKLGTSRNKALDNIYEGQVKKIKSLIATLHEDLQYDYTRQVNALAV
jgi:hypothetical protein